jgi:hypothetical protein
MAIGEACLGDKRFTQILQTHSRSSATSEKSGFVELRTGSCCRKGVWPEAVVQFTS